MLFNSYGFIFIYLPLVLGAFFLIGSRSIRVATLWLVLASVFFYGWWNYKFVGLLLLSISGNYGAARLIERLRPLGRSRGVLITALAANLALLGVYKYANFFIATLTMAGAHLRPVDIVLPLGISFFTFTQIAFLVDVHRGIARETSLLHYALFVTWFPHLIAGPVLHHKQMMPQFAAPATYRPDGESITVGLTLFTLGLFKKVMLADTFSAYANPIFTAAATGAQPNLVEAWIGAVAYALQLYFDFSGYSDMAIGISRLFNIRLPLNFNSPYKAENIIEFWRRWHMTLSAFLRDYLYIPLGGNRKGSFRRYSNLMVTMLLGGLWHGAGWNFVLWGGLHGIYLIINHGWHAIKGAAGAGKSRTWTHGPAVALTFLAVVVAWVPFRAANLSATLAMWRGLAGMNGLALPAWFSPYLGPLLGEHASFDGMLRLLTERGPVVFSYLFFGLLIVWVLPNTQEWLANYAPAWDRVAGRPRFSWKPTIRHATFTGLLLGLSLLGMNLGISEFLYFQF